MAKNLPMKKTIIATLVVASVASLSLIAGNGVADTVSSVNKLNTVATGTITTASNNTSNNANNNTTTTTTSTATAVSVGPVAVTKVSVSNIGQPLKAVIYLNKDIASATFANGSMSNESSGGTITLSTEKINDKQVIVLKTTTAYNEAVAHVSLSVTDLDGKINHLSITLTPAIPASAPVAQAAPMVNSSANSSMADNDSSDDTPIVHKKKHKKEVANVASSNVNSNNNASDSASTNGLSADAAFVYKKLQAQQERTVELAKQYQDTLNQQLNLLQKQKKDLTNQEQIVDGKITDLQQKIQDANTNLGHILNNSTNFSNSVNSTSSTNTTTTNVVNSSTVNNLPVVPVPTPSTSVNSNSNNSIAPTITAPTSTVAASSTSVTSNTSNNAGTVKHDIKDVKKNADKPEFNVVLPTTNNANISDKALLEGPASAVKLSDKDKATINQGLNLPSTSSTSMADMVASQVNAASAPSVASATATNPASASASTAASSTSPASAPVATSEASGVLAASDAKPKHPIKKHHVAQPKPVVEDKSIIDTIMQGIMDNGLYVGVGVVVIALLGALGVVRKKANKNKAS